MIITISNDLGFCSVLWIRDPAYIAWYNFCFGFLSFPFFFCFLFWWRVDRKINISRSGLMRPMIKVDNL
ncbi:hypothetical protein BDV25DRAFT_156478, partial [Aspergillus avenaceus]